MESQLSLFDRILLKDQMDAYSALNDAKAAEYELIAHILQNAHSELIHQLSDSIAEHKESAERLQ